MIMFTRKDCFAFVTSALLTGAGFICMALDSTPNGFGVLTLWIAPPLLLSGFLAPVFGILGIEALGVPSLTKWKRQTAKHVFGLITFLVAASIYILTLEPTASLWDCSEFIASAYKLQVPHTPGTPLALLIGRLFSMLSFGDAEKVAWCVNLMSGLFSAMTVTLVYYIIFHLGQRMRGGKENDLNVILVSSSVAGSLCLAFSDTFWFSAVEAETYGLACFFLMLLVWLILTGKDRPEPLRSRRLILIFYIAGLAYCIHPMCLLALTLMPFTWFARVNNTPERQRRDKACLVSTSYLKGTLLTIACGLAIVILINRFVAVGLFELAFSFDRFFVNHLHLPFYSGAFILIALLTIIFAQTLKRFKSLRPFTWAALFLLFGFIPYVMLFIRSNHNPPIDETNPENLALIKAYMNRESYPSSPLLFGPYFDAQIEDIEVKKQMYYKGTDAYHIAGTLPEYQYNSRQTILPRIYSNDPNHVEAYRTWLGLRPTEKPSFSDNLSFLFTYQLGHMYLRYLMWNFAGRESDEQNSGWLRPWDGLDSSPFENARNQYWMIPLFIGLLGAIVQIRRDAEGFTSIAILFMMTGAVLALYLNSPPIEPRERDYIYVGSYIAFCIWIGLGMLEVQNFVCRLRFFNIVGSLAMIGIPLWMLYQNYDDHDRSGRTFQVDNARNVLSSCARNSILFTGGDNDTFPLWYLQEVEGFRTDVRVMVLSYMNTDWYINQLRKSYYDSGAFKLTLGENDYRQYGPNDVLYVQESIKHEIDLRQYLKLLKKEHPALRHFARNGEPYHILPGRKLKITVDKNSAPLVNAKDGPSGKDHTEMIFNIADHYLSKNALAILDLIMSNEWKRPIHFNFTSANTLGIALTPYLRQEGPVYRLVPDKHAGENAAVNTDLSYKNLIERADYSNLRDSTIHLSYEDHHSRMLVPIRQSFNALAVAFLNEDKPQRAESVLMEAKDRLYYKHLRPSYTNLQAAQILMELNRKDEADLLITPAFEYYFHEVKRDLHESRKPEEIDKYLLRQSAELLARLGKPGYLEQIEGM
jgi:hypothetical protein